ncbi:MAG: class I SAM-dependent methyltransferase [Acidobacteriota bacterium]
MTAETTTSFVPPWEPLGRAIADWYAGDETAEVTVLLDDGHVEALPIAVMARHDGWPPADEMALELASGRVLDVGAGVGAHVLELQERGHEVVAIDVLARAVEVMRRRGVEDARQVDVFGLEDATGFDTILLLMNGAGIGGDLDGLGRLLAQCHRLITPLGQILVESADLAADKGGLAVHRRYPGELTYQMVYRGDTGMPFPWLFVDAEQLAHSAAHQGLRSQVVFADAAGGYLARLTPDGSG